MSPARALYLASTAAVLVVPAWSVLRGPLPLEVVLGITSVYVALSLVGVFFLGLRMYTDALVRLPRGARGVALTFDDGPDPVTTPKVLDVLDAHDAKATFFVIGKKAEAHPELVREIVRRGHTVGMHSYAHHRLFSLKSPAYVRADLTRALGVLEGILGERPTLFRPPIGHTNPIIARIADELELDVIGWSAGARDGLAGTTKEDVLARLVPAAKDGAILLLHDAPEVGSHEPAGVAALPELLDKLHAERIPVVPLVDTGEGGESRK